MMKRILACVVAMACLLTALAACAVAEGESLGDMKVIKVKEAVNLRKGPSTDTASLGTVPLGSIVNDCTTVPGSDWIAVNYNGVAGYIRGDFLEDVPEPEPEPELQPVPAAEGEAEAEEDDGKFVPDAEAPVENINQPTEYNDDFVILDDTVGGVRVIARQIFQEDVEYLMIVGLDGSGNELWKKETNTGDVSELTQTEAFIAGTESSPLVMMYNDWVGLDALDPATGEVRWSVPKDDVFLGGSISYAVGGNGVVYIGGYYGPDPVAIDAGGNVLWQADASSVNATWLQSIELRGDGIACRYSSMEGEKTGTIVFDYNGVMTSVETDW